MGKGFEGSSQSEVGRGDVERVYECNGSQRWTRMQGANAFSRSFGMAVVGQERYLRAYSDRDGVLQGTDSCRGTLRKSERKDQTEKGTSGKRLNDSRKVIC